MGCGKPVIIGYILMPSSYSSISRGIQFPYVYKIKVIAYSIETVIFAIR